MANGWINSRIRKALYSRDMQYNGEKCENPTCAYCGTACLIGIANQSLLSIEEKKRIGTLDHIVPQRELYDASESFEQFCDARRDPKNLVLACQACNSSKQDIPLFVWCAKTGKEYSIVIAEIARRINTPIA